MHTWEDAEDVVQNESMIMIVMMMKKVMMKIKMNMMKIIMI